MNYLAQIIQRDAVCWGVFLIFALVLTIKYVLANSEHDLQTETPRLNLVVLFICVIVLITFLVGPDKWVYESKFNKLVSLGHYKSLYIGWDILTKAIAKILPWPALYFFILAFIYVGSNYLFCKFHVNNPLPLFVAVISFMGFYSYGVNTLKSGIGLAFFYAAIVLYDKNKWYGILAAIFAIAIHKSMLLPLLFLTLSKFIKKSEYCYAIWFLCIILSLSFGTYFRITLGEFFGEQERFSRYLIFPENQRYQVGFRWDLLLYSMVPIFVGYLYQKAHYVDDRWSHYYRTYILTNSFWILINTMAFSDRMAYLSWFWIPYLLFIPLLDPKSDIPNIKINMCLLYLIFSGFNLYQIFA